LESIDKKDGSRGISWDPGARGVVVDGVKGIRSDLRTRWLELKGVRGVS